MDKQKIKIIRKNDEYSAEYQIGDIFQVDSTWYGGERMLQAYREYLFHWIRMSMCF